ncbi:MAG: ATP phosphoribosyltransferase [Treponema sp.]|jgi:ATP phosphoribosyltransferase|nr:ATP phosphoribosyltransferase [Treponema sp.]
MRKIVIALPKGRRLIAQAYEVFKDAGFPSRGLEQEIELKERKLLEFSSDDGSLTFLLVRIEDIPQYVDKNWADIGISAFDCYREYELSNVTAKKSMRGDNFISDILPDLKLCQKSRFCVAGRPENLDFYNKCKKSDEKILTVATEHPNIAEGYFTKRGIVVDIVTVSGSTELMPQHGEVDAIFDIVETGRALEENGLIIFDEAMPIKTKILVSKAALKYDENISRVIGALRNALA